MALDCGVDDAWAEYGQAHKRPEYKLLQDVTHWTPEEVEREQIIKAREHVHPTHTLSTFADILNHFEFRDFQANAERPTDSRRQQIIDVWKTVVDVQQHFNDIEMRIRSMFVTTLLALFASIGFLMDKKFTFPLGPLQIQFAAIVPLIGIFGTLLFYFIDRYWYHRLLVGSVNHAITIEKKYRDEMPELCLSDAIGKVSPYEPKRRLVRWLAQLLVTEDRMKTTGRLHSDGKIELFYKSVAAVLILVFVLILVMGGVKIDTVTTAPTKILDLGGPG